MDNGIKASPTLLTYLDRPSIAALFDWGQAPPPFFGITLPFRPPPHPPHFLLHGKIAVIVVFYPRILRQREQARARPWIHAVGGSAPLRVASGEVYWTWTVSRESVHLTLLFGTDPDRNRVTWETPSSEAIPFRWKPLRRTRLLRDPAQTQVWSEQVWLNTTFIWQGSRSRVKTKLKIITILHIIITTTLILNLSENNCAKNIGAYSDA